jgi:hypothetical protein
MKIKQFIKKYSLQISCIGISIFNVCAVGGVALYQNKIIKNYQEKTNNIYNQINELETEKQSLIDYKTAYSNNILSDYSTLSQQYYFTETYLYASNYFLNTNPYGYLDVNNSYCPISFFTKTYSPFTFAQLIGAIDKSYTLDTQITGDDWFYYMPANASSFVQMYCDYFCDSSYLTNYTYRELMGSTSLPFTGLSTNAYCEISCVGKVSKYSLVNYRLTLNSLTMNDDLYVYDDDTGTYTFTPSKTTKNPCWFGFFTSRILIKDIDNFEYYTQNTNIIDTSYLIFSNNWSCMSVNNFFDYAYERDLYVYSYCFVPTLFTSYYSADSSKDYVTSLKTEVVPNSSTLSQDSVIESNDFYNDYISTLDEYESTISELNEKITNLNNQITSLKSQIKVQDYDFNDLIFSVVTIPSTFLSQWFSVEILGVNIWSVVLSLVSGVLIIYLIRKLL